MPRHALIAVIICHCLSTAVLAQQPVSVGKGSYAASPPPGLVVDKKRNADLVNEVETRKLYLVNDDGRPVPSNKWYQNLILQKYGTGLWAMPHKIDATAEGIEVFYPTKFNTAGTGMVTDFPLVVAGVNFKPVDSRARHWTDWTVTFRMFESEDRYVDVTLGEGMPYVWCEFRGVQPVLALGGNSGKGSRGKGEARFFDLSGIAAQLPRTGDTLGVTYEGRSYAVFTPDDTRFERSPDGITVHFAGSSSFLVIAPLPEPRDIRKFHQHAFAVPRDTRLAWTYDRTAGAVTTTWDVTAEPLKGNSKSVLQGFLPHHWRETTSPLAFSDVTYNTMRGPLKCAVGERFSLRHAFNGILPNLPAPAAVAGGLDAGRMKSYLAEPFANPTKLLGADTYWGGKSLQQQAQAAYMAVQTGDPAAPAIIGKLRSTMEDWLTYTPGEKDRFFAYYPRRKGLVGFNVAYGSQHFTDHHFHQGYFTFAAALLCQLQPDFAEQYGQMIKLVARNYANYDRNDQRFPYFRTFDLWRGHSFADGNGFPDGNNQESTGEAVNSWAGLILLGEALGDPDMIAAGVMGYTFESRANLEYWFDPHGDVFPPAYKHDACGMIWCNSIVWGTWFTASPAWIYGIQWIPSAPHGAFYDRDRDFIRKTYADVIRELHAFEEKEAARKPGYVRKPVTIKALGGELGSYHLGFQMHADPASVVKQINDLWAEPDDKVARDPWMAAIYYQANALVALGRVDWACHGSSPTSMVYKNEATGTRTLVAWNPTGKPQIVEFFEGTVPVGKLTVPPHGTARSVAD